MLWDCSHLLLRPQHYTPIISGTSSLCPDTLNKEIKDSTENLKAQYQPFSSKVRREFDDDLEGPTWDDISDTPQRKAENTQQGPIYIG